MGRDDSRPSSVLPPTHRWDAVPSPRAAVHIVHGMAEHGARYARFAARPERGRPRRVGPRSSRARHQPDARNPGPLRRHGRMERRPAGRAGRLGGDGARVSRDSPRALRPLDGLVHGAGVVARVRSHVRGRRTGRHERSTRRAGGRRARAGAGPARSAGAPRAGDVAEDDRVRAIQPPVRTHPLGGRLALARPGGGGCLSARPAVQLRHHGASLDGLPRRQGCGRRARRDRAHSESASPLSRSRGPAIRLAKTAKAWSDCSAATLRQA